MLTQPTSFNNKLIVESYKVEGIREEIRGGIARPGQKNSLKGLKVLVQATLSDGTLVPSGSTAWIKEELLHSQPWAKNKLKCDTLPGEFLVITMNEVEYIEPPHGDAA